MNSFTKSDVQRLALPAIVANISEPLIALVDTAIIGHLGDSQLAGVGIASSLFLLVIWILAQTKSAISAIVSKYYGKNQLNEISSFTLQSFIINTLAGVAVFGIISGFSIPILKMYNAQGDVLHYANEYLLIRSFGFPLTLGTLAFFGIFRGIQNTSWAMKISLIGGLINLILDFVLVNGVESIIPALGVQGAAWASLISQMYMFVMAFIYWLRKTPFAANALGRIHQEIRPMLKMSFDLFIRAGILNIAYYLGTSTSALYGEAATAAHTIAMNIWLFSAFFIDGYANAGNAIAGKLLGAGKLKELSHLTNHLLRSNGIISLGLALIYTIFYGLLGRIFSESEEVLQAFSTIFWMVIISQPINSVAFTLDGIFKGLGRSATLRNNQIVATGLAFFPVILLTRIYDWNLTGVWIAFLSWMIARGLYLKIALNKMT